MHISRGQLLSLVLVLAGCGLQPYSLTSDTGTTSTTADATLTTSPPSTTAEPTTGPDTTTGGPVPGVWHGVLQYHDVEESWLPALTFADCASGQRWFVSTDLLPGCCGVVERRGAPRWEQHRQQPTKQTSPVAPTKLCQCAVEPKCAA